MKILVLTVGGSHQPLVTAIQTLKPDRVVFLCSDDTPTAKGSYLQVIGDGKVIKSDLKLEKPDLPNLVVQTALSPDRYKLVKIRNFDSLEECYLESRNSLEKLHRQYPGSRLIADYTGGTKSMTAGLALAAVDDEHCEISLVTGTRPDLKTVQDQTQFARPMVVWDLRGRRKLEEVQIRLSRYDYAGAAALLETIGQMPIGESFLQKITAGIAICRGLDAWDRFNHQRPAQSVQEVSGGGMHHPG
jgi:CRISPR-associated protein (TIGR02710 family)